MKPTIVARPGTYRFGAHLRGVETEALCRVGIAPDTFVPVHHPTLRHVASGYDAGKKVKSRRRQVTVDTNGRGLILAPQAASVQDCDGAPLVLRLSCRLFPS